MSGKRSWLPLLVYFLHALVWVFLLPPWQGPDEPGHYEYARLWAELGRPPQTGDVRYALQAEIIRELDRHNFWTLTHQARPNPLPVRFEQNPFLQRSGSQLGNETPLYYALPAQVMRLVHAPLLHMYIGRLWSALLGSLVILAAVWGAPFLWPRNRRLQGVFPLFLALLPMPTFIHATFNSTVLADVVGAFFFLTAWQLLRSPAPSWKGWGALGVLTVLAFEVKRTTWPLLPLALAVIYLRPPQWLRPRRHWIPYGILGVFLVLALFPSVPFRAAHWTEGKARQPALRVPLPSRPGDHALLLDSEQVSRGRPYVAQDLGAARVTPLRGSWVKFQARVRSVQGPTWVCMSVIDQYGRSTACETVTGAWQQWGIRHLVHPGATFVRVVVGLGNPHTRDTRGRILIDDLRLSPLAGFDNVLENGQVERPLSRWERLARGLGWRWEGLTAEAFAQRLFWAAAILFTSFWGNFGWLQYPFPLPLYGLLACITLIALWGGVRRMLRSRFVGGQDILWKFNALSVTWVVLVNLLSTLQPDWYPQGRYLFPALLPMLALGLDGLESWFANDKRWIFAGALLAGGALLALASFATVIMGMYVKLP